MTYMADWSATTKNESPIITAISKDFHTAISKDFHIKPSLFTACCYFAENHEYY